MKEATDQKYLVDGFMLKHFEIWPIGVDKNNLFDKQKVFLMYLMGSIPSVEDWSSQMDYERKLLNIQSINRVDIEDSDIDMAKLQGRDIRELKAERLKLHIKAKILELNKSFGIPEDEDDERDVEKDIPTVPKTPPAMGSQGRQAALFDLLNGKKDIGQDSGLQDKI